jgi:hypothetical protein
LGGKTTVLFERVKWISKYAITDRVLKVPKGCSGDFCHFWRCLTPGISKELEPRETNSVRLAEIRAKTAALVP